MMDVHSNEQINSRVHGMLQRMHIIFYVCFLQMYHARTLPSSIGMHRLPAESTASWKTI